MDITEKIDDLIEGKKKKFKIKIDSDVMDQKKGIRIPTPPTGGTMKDKKKYNRKQKYKKVYEAKIPLKWGNKKNDIPCDHCKQIIGKGYGGQAKIKGHWVDLCDDCMEEIEMNQ